MDPHTVKRAIILCRIDFTLKYKKVFKENRYGYATIGLKI